MSKTNIIIAGGGFAGVSALRYFFRYRHLLDKNFKLILIDRKEYSEFLPMLPDVIGGWLNPDVLRLDLRLLSGKLGCEFIKGDIELLNLEKKKINVSGRDIDFQYVVISSGSETNFYGNDKFGKMFYKLDNVEDAVKIKTALLEKVRAAQQINVVIIGGGYTGVEIATNVKFLLERQKIIHNIYVIEKAPDILTVVPDWLRNEVRQELERLKIECICQDAVKNYEGETLTLDSGRQIKDAFCIWTAGVKTGDFLKQPDLLSERTRIRVDNTLRPLNRIGKDVFFAGDTAFFTDKKIGGPLRMAVMFSIEEGKTAAQNIINNISKKILEEYKPVDLGYLIPIAQGKAPGLILGRKVHGFSGYLSHYFMCLYRSERRNKLRLLKSLAVKSLSK